MKRKDIECEELSAIFLDDCKELAERDEALYCFLNERITARLKRKFDAYAGGLRDGFEDVLLDFFLYLRDTGDEPYQIFKSIRNQASLDTWILTTFRNFLGKRADAENKLPKCVCLCSEPIDNQTYDAVNVERLIGMLSKLVAYCCQEFKPVFKFIFLRMMLTLLDKKRALPDKDVAQAIGMTHVYYRVINHRVRHMVLDYRNLLLNGEHLPLSTENQCFAELLSNDFSGWYAKLAVCYDATVASLAQSDAINAMRLARSVNGSGLLHDGLHVQYGDSLAEVREFWKSLDSYLRE